MGMSMWEFLITNWWVREHLNVYGAIYRQVGMGYMRKAAIDDPGSKPVARIPP